MIITLVVFLAHLAGALTSVRAVMETRTSQGAIAWVVSLNTFPYIAESCLITAREVNDRGFWSRFTIRAARLMAPVQ